MTDRDIIDLLFHRLANAPRGMDVSNAEVLAATGMLVSAILQLGGFEDPIAEANRFGQALATCVHKAMARQARQIH
jgi:hypothetical protein